MNKTGKRFCCTLSFEKWNYTEIDLNNIQYYIIAFETAEDGYEHYHAYIVFKKNMRYAGIKKLFGDKTMHIEHAEGTNEQAANYVKKDGDIIFEYGEYAKKAGERMDLKKLVSDIRNGMSDRDITDEHTAAKFKYDRSINKIRNEELQIKAKALHGQAVDVIYIWGEAGTGKTRYVYDHEELDNVYNVCANGDQSVWWDGYNGQEAILFDDFRGQIKATHMLQLLDRYYCQLPVKGSFTYKAWKRVYITSNIPPECQYKEPHNTKAFLRRVKTTLNI